jgi:hypothetical protein
LRVERLIGLRAETLGYHKPPVIKWLPDPRSAFDYLRRYELADLLRMENATFWREEDLPAIEDDTILDRWCVTHRFATDALRPDDHDRALMAPKLEAKRQLVARRADPDAIFEARAMAAQVGWLETSISAAAVGAISSIDLQLAQGLSEVSVHLHHQLLVIEAYQHGLIATWETPTELVCVPRPFAADWHDQGASTSGSVCLAFVQEQETPDDADKCPDQPPDQQLTAVPWAAFV